MSYLSHHLCNLNWLSGANVVGSRGFTLQQLDEAFGQIVCVQEVSGGCGINPKRRPFALKHLDQRRNQTPAVFPLTISQEYAAPDARDLMFGADPHCQATSSVLGYAI